MVRVGASKLVSTVGRAAAPLLRWQVCTCRQRANIQHSKEGALVDALVITGASLMF